MGWGQGKKWWSPLQSAVPEVLSFFLAVGDTALLPVGRGTREEIHETCSLCQEHSRCPVQVTQRQPQWQQYPRAHSTSGRGNMEGGNMGKVNVTCTPTPARP